VRNSCLEMADAFIIFAKYAYESGEVAAEHDIIYAGPQVCDTDTGDAYVLRELGWHEDENGGWAKFT